MKLKFTMLVFSLLFTTLIFAQNVVNKEPVVLTRERIKYEASIKAAVDPITAKYLKTLDVMKKRFGGNGDLVSAQAVQDEIDRLTEKNQDKQVILGKWFWAKQTSEFFKDGSATQTPNITGRWRCLNKSKRQYQVVWSHGYTDWIVISSNGNDLVLQNNKGTKHTGHRIPHTK